MEIKKLEDVVAWLDDWIEETKLDLTEEDMEDDTTIKEFETIKKVILESIEEIENLKKELDAREKEIMELNIKIRHQRENLDGVNRTLEVRTKENESLVKVRNNLNKEIEAHESENKRLSDKIIELKKEQDKHMARVNDLRMELDCVKASKEKELESEYVHVTKYNKIVHSIDLRVEENKKLRKEIDGLREDVKYWKEAFETQATSLAEVRKCNDSLVDTLNKSSDKVDELEKQIKNLEKELDKTCTTKELDLKGHNRREMALVNELADKNDEIKSLKEENSYLKSEIKQKQNIIKKAYDRYSDEVIKTRKDLMEVAYRGIEKDNGYVGFKLYVKNALIEAKGDKNEANEIITEAVRSAYTEWDKTQKENEKTIEKAIKEVKSKRSTPDIPCGEDAIE